MSWPTEALGSLCDVISGGTPKRTVDEYWNGEIPWVKISDMLQGEIKYTDESITDKGLRESPARLLESGTLLLSIFATVGRTAVLSIPAATNQAIVGLRIKTENLDQKYLRHYLDSQAEALKSKSRGVAQDNINTSILKCLKIPLPPLEEQRRIAAILDKAGSLQKLSQSAITKLHQTLESSFRRLSSITACNCASKRLEEVVEAIIDYRGKSPEKTAEGVPLITARLIKEGRILEATEFIAPESYSEWMRRGMPKRGDVVFTTEAPLGQVAQIDNPDVALAQRLILLRGKSKELDNTYLRFALRMNSVAEQIRKRATGSTVLGIRQKELRQIEIPLPALEVQKDFARLALAIESEIQRLRHRADSVKALKDSLANQLVEG